MINLAKKIDIYRPVIATLANEDGQHVRYLKYLLLCACLPGYNSKSFAEANQRCGMSDPLYADFDYLARWLDEVSKEPVTHHFIQSRWMPVIDVAEKELKVPDVLLVGSTFSLTTLTDALEKAIVANIERYITCLSGVSPEDISDATKNWHYYAGNIIILFERLPYMTNKLVASLSSKTVGFFTYLGDVCRHPFTCEDLDEHGWRDRTKLVYTIDQLFMGLNFECREDAVVLDDAAPYFSDIWQQYPLGHFTKQNWHQTAAYLAAQHGAKTDD